MRGEFLIRREGPRAALVRTGFAEAFDALGLLGAAGEPPEELAGRTARVARAARTRRPGGRGAVLLLETEAGDALVVRPYRRGGLPGRVLRSRYFLGNRAFRELILTERLRRAGLPLPEPLAAVQEARFPGYRAALVTRRVPDVRTAAELLAAAGPEEVARLLERMGRSVGRLHAAGLLHADLNAHNLLLDPEARDRPAVVLDLDRGRLLPPPLPSPLARANLRRLRRSLSKLGLRAALEGWEAFEAGYRSGLGGRGGSQAGIRRRSSTSGP